ncbi:MAG: hypothetical protein AAB466_11555 [Verrucomicrobiota bacterium]
MPEELNFAKTPLMEAIGYKERVNSNVWSRIEVFTRYPKGTNAGWGNVWEGKKTDLDAFRQALVSETNSLPSQVRPPVADAFANFSVWEPELNELREASKRPYAQLEPQQPPPLRFSFVQLSQPEWSHVPHYPALRILAQRCLIHGLAELKLGRADESFADAAVIVKLGGLFEAESYASLQDDSWRDHWWARRSTLLGGHCQRRVDR